jgi:type I restriction enzyme S subunit
MTGGTPARSKPEYFGGPIRWLVSGDIHQGEIQDCEGRITEAGMKNSNAKPLPVNSVMIALNGQGKTRGTVALLRTHATCNQSLVSIYPNDIGYILPQFLYANLHGRYQELRRLTGDDGNDRRGLNMDLIRGIEIPIAPIQEQQRIVTILNEAFEGIATAKANAEKNLQNAHSLFIEQIQAVFLDRGEGWIDQSLGDIAQIKGGKRVPKGYKLLSEPTPYPYLRVTDFSESGSIDLTNLRYVSEEVHLEIRNYIIRSSDLYLSIAGTIGKTGIIQTELDGAHLTENACRLVFKPGINSRFVYYFTITPSFTEQAGLNTRTAAQPKLALSRLSRIVIGIPDSEEQDRLVANFDELRCETERLECIYQQKLTALDELKQSLHYQAFRGQL